MIRAIGPTASRRTHLEGLGIACAGVLCLSPDALLIRLIDTDVWDVVFWRTLLTAVTLAVVLAVRHRGRLRELLGRIGRVGFVSGVLFGITSTLFVAAISHTRAANALVILATAPLFAAIGTRLVGGDVVPARTWWTIVAAFGGIVAMFVGSLGEPRLTGDVLALILAVVAGTNLVVLRSARERNMLPSIAIGGVLAAIVALVATDPFDVSGGDLALLGVMGLVQIPLALTLLVFGTRRIPAAEVGLLLLLETVLGPVWVWLGVGEEPGVNALVGGTVVVAALAVHSVFGLRAEREAVPAPSHG